MGFAEIVRGAGGVISKETERGEIEVLLVDRLTEYADLMGRVTVVEVTGPMNHPGLVDFVGDLLARQGRLS